MSVTLELMQSGTLVYQPFIDKESSRNYMIMKKQLYWQGTFVMTSKTWPFMEQINCLDATRERNTTLLGTKCKYICIKCASRICGAVAFFLHSLIGRL